MSLQGIKIRLYLTGEQKKFASQQLGCARFIYNQLLDFRTKYYEVYHSSPSSQETSEFLQTLKDSNLWLRDVNSKVLQQSQRDLDQAFANFFRRVKKGEAPGYPTFKSKHDNLLTCRFPKDAIIDVQGNRISLIKKFKDILFKCSREDMRWLNRNFDKIHSATLTKDKTKKYCLSALVERDRFRQLKGNNAIGIDLGLKDFAVTSEGEVISNPRFLKKEISNIKHL